MAEYLECPVCGEDVFPSETGYWYDGTDGSCDGCGLDLVVVVDEDGTVGVAEPVFAPCPWCGEVTLCSCAADATEADRAHDEKREDRND